MRAARKLLVEASGLTEAEHRAEAWDWYLSVIRDVSSSWADRLKAREHLGRANLCPLPLNTPLLSDKLHLRLRTHELQVLWAHEFGDLTQRTFCTDLTVARQRRHLRLAREPDRSRRVAGFMPEPPWHTGLATDARVTDNQAFPPEK